MTHMKDVLLAQMGASDFLFTKMTADLSDEEYFKIPMPCTNHVGWCVGHVGVSEDRMSAAIGGTDPRTSETIQNLFVAGSTCEADASKYPSRAEIDNLFRDNRAHMIEHLKSFDDAKWDNPSPEGWDKNIFPTLGAIWAMMATHPYWHVGHMTVCRAAMGKGQVLG